MLNLSTAMVGVFFISMVECWFMGKKERRVVSLDALIRLLPGVIDAMVKSAATELTAKNPHLSLDIRRSLPTGEILPIIQEASPPPVELEQRDPYEDKTRYYRLTSPLPGEFYRRPNPQSEPYVEEGYFVEEGQVLCVIAVNKTLNEITAERGGRVVKIVAQNEQLVEKGEVLMILDTSQTPPALPSPYV